MTKKYLIEINAPSEAALGKSAANLQVVASRLTPIQLEKLAEVALKRPALIQKAIAFLGSPLAKAL